VLKVSLSRSPCSNSSNNYFISHSVQLIICIIMKAASQICVIPMREPVVTRSRSKRAAELEWKAEGCQQRLSKLWAAGVLKPHCEYNKRWPAGTLKPQSKDSNTSVDSRVRNRHRRKAESSFQITHAQFRVSALTKRCIIEICTSSDSSIGKIASEDFPECLVIRITKQHCFHSREGCWAVKQLLQQAYERYGRENILLWFSLPCTGGCSFQSINLRRAIRKRDHRAIRRFHLLQHQFQLLMTSTISLLEFAVILGAGAFPNIAHEWPKSCRYWKTDIIISYVERFHLSTSQCDGCMLGVVSLYGPCQGTPIRKSWYIKTNNHCVSQSLSVECDGSHQHTPCQGRNTSQTERYPQMFARQLHLGWMTHCSER